MTLHCVTRRFVWRRVRCGGLVGESGAGTSTLVKALSGMLARDAGTVAVGGAEVRLGGHTARRQAGICTAFQELSLLPNLTS